jgi:hypothetical protein
MKKGYFFTLDAFIAMSVLIVCVILIFSIHSAKPYPLQSIFISDDMMYYLSSTRCYELQSQYVQSLISNGTIGMPENSLIEQIAVFYMDGKNGTARNFTRNVMGGMIPGKYGVQLRIYNSSTGFVDRLSEGGVSESGSRLLITSKKILFGMINETTWGPMTGEVRLWQ